MSFTVPVLTCTAFDEVPATYNVANIPTLTTSAVPFRYDYLFAGDAGVFNPDTASGADRHWFPPCWVAGKNTRTNITPTPLHDQRTFAAFRTGLFAVYAAPSGQQ